MYDEVLNCEERKGGEREGGRGRQLGINANTITGKGC